ncbi:MAG: mechanosensitive ion channel family protein [Magnetococcales bacterium]|nr:mechanosensitive ion channel family protein [Magnetococcales bacterium]MBF0438554.1 mechanosensitive ion channel family protein [Magnetococcales bacterium]
MDSFTLIAITLGGFLVVFLIATLLTLPLRSKEKTPEQMAAIETNPANQPSDESSWLAILLGYTSRPLAILVLTWLLMRGLNTHSTITMDPRYIKAWYLFWLSLLFFNCNEALGRLFYYFRKRHFPVPGLLLFLLRLLLIGITAFMILHFVLDFDTSHLLTSTAVVAAVVGIALREVLSNFLAGISMNLVGTAESSQWIVVGDKEGEIIQRNWRETRLRTTGGHILIIPNSILAGSVINNMTWSSPLRRHQLNVPLIFNAAPQQVKEALLEAALGVREVERSKMPDAYIYEYKDYGVVYQLRFWSRTYFDRSRLEGTVRERIWYQLRRRGLEIPFPQGGDLSVAKAPHNLTENEPSLARNERLLRSSGFLERTLGATPNKPILRPDEIQQLAAALQYRIYGPGEIIFRQGEVGTVCYLVVKGQLIGSTQYEGMSTTQEFTIEQGELAGEMALMTGLPRSSTIQAARQEVELLEFSKELFTRFLENPAVNDGVSAQMAQRSKHLFEDLQRLELGQH